MPSASPAVEDPAEALALEAEIRSTLRAFLADVAPLAVTRRYLDGTGDDPSVLWRRMVGELGLVGLAVPTVLGGDGLAPGLAGVVFEELGRNLVPVPSFGTLGLAVPLLTALGTDDAVAALAPVISGSSIATVGWVGPAGDWDPRSTPVRIDIEGSTATVNGRLHHVIDGDRVDRLFVVGRDPSGALGVVSVAADAVGLRFLPADHLDPTRPAAGVELTDVEGEVVGAGDCSDAVVRAVLTGAALLAAESAGAARHALELTVEYVKVRHQFGRPIGSFQAVKHRCADMLARVELMSALAAEAVDAVSESGNDARETVLAAAAYAADAFTFVASEMIQLHGGIGFTWEHDAHLFFRRAKSSEVTFGAAAELRSAIALQRGWRA
ncbi:acyl-CoA dehydrogenase [Nakamurella sp. YIM 132087]|uniref:Acyl-CoA dehydrogenase n=1 Tax=Nakamurella alba TaxID=2665158 RepID=A0A7K1FED0_9ACTN|nr:acyl-CoA dehydrogenase family protein [Nakamurella alba]MTD12430.1 acyl-CoA dehydrogenase [Nakamurella alba]